MCICVCLCMFVYICVCFHVLALIHIRLIKKNKMNNFKQKNGSSEERIDRGSGVVRRRSWQRNRVVRRRS